MIETKATKYTIFPEVPFSDWRYMYARLTQSIGLGVTGPPILLLLTDAPCHSRCDTLKNPHCLMAIGSEHI